MGRGRVIEKCLVPSHAQDRDVPSRARGQPNLEPRVGEFAEKHVNMRGCHMIVDSLTKANPTEDRKESLNAASNVYRPLLIQALRSEAPARGLTSLEAYFDTNSVFKVKN